MKARCGEGMYRNYLARSAVFEASSFRGGCHGHLRSVNARRTAATVGKERRVPNYSDVWWKADDFEGGAYQGVYADEAWRRNPKKGWMSYIPRGIVRGIETNGTLRIFHGYPTETRDAYCR